jgi:hypothetical protein
MKRSALRLLAATLVLFSFSAAWAEDDHAYTEGAVVSVGYIRTEPGKFDDYMRYLASTYKSMMEAEKKAGLILDYGVYQAFPRNLNEPDLILTITFKNMAALDGLEAKADPIVKQIFSSLKKADEGFADRGKIRTNLGGEILRELILK